MGAIRNSVRRRAHKERSQPINRQAKFGLLEKKSDYKLRAEDYHRKEKRIKALREKALNKNPDEFYYAMASHGKTDGGIHKNKRTGSNKLKDKRAEKTLDMCYVTMKKTMEDKKIDRMKGELHLVGAAPVSNQHVIFVDDDDQVRNFNAAEHFETHPTLVDQAHNRLRVVTLNSCKMPTSTEIEKASKSSKERYVELSRRLERDEKLTTLMSTIQTEKNLLGKGRRRKVGNEYIWKKERKK